MTESLISSRGAGCCAIAAGFCWVIWGVMNTVTQGAFERSDAASPAPIMAPLLTAGWNILLVPAALRLHQECCTAKPGLAPLWTAAGLLSLSFWAFGGLTHVTRPLETVYLLLAAVWLLGIGPLLRLRRPKLAVFTLVVGSFTALDAAFTLFEPMPFAFYLLAAPKLPLSAAWSIAVGVVLFREPAASA